MDPVDRPECLPGTRSELLKYIANWLTTPSDRNIIWLNGPAGTGKSTIATTIATHFLRSHRRGAFLFFDRKASSEPGSVIRNLAYRLGHFDPRIGEAISSVIANNSEILSASFTEQFSQLLLEP